MPEKESHYVLAERYAQSAERNRRKTRDDFDRDIALAQVHAILAHVEEVSNTMQPLVDRNHPNWSDILGRVVDPSEIRPRV